MMIIAQLGDTQETNSFGSIVLIAALLLVVLALFSRKKR